jgi:hypothetical protein
MLIAGAAGVVAPLPAWAGQDGITNDAIQRGRATVPIELNGGGRYRFAVDTAANCSVVAEDLVTPLGLEPMGELGMHTLVGREIAPAVRADRLRSGALDIRYPRLAVGKRAAMAGLDGLIGTDLLHEHRLTLNFRGTDRIRIAPSNAPTRTFRDQFTARSELIASGEPGFGDLLVIPARIGLTSGYAIVDTGAEGTLINRPAAVAGRATPLTLPVGRHQFRIQSPSGQAIVADAMTLRTLAFAGVTVSAMPVAVGDFHTFRYAGLQDQPAVLIGLDVFQLFASVYIDLKRGEFVVRL